MKIMIQNSSNMPIYQQIYEQIKESILSQQLSKDELLPSIRQLSRDLKVSVITTTRAYTDLESDGLISIVPGKGCYVKAIDQGLLEENILQDIEEHFAQIVKDATLLNKTPDELLILLHQLMEEIQDDA